MEFNLLLDTNTQVLREFYLRDRVQASIDSELKMKKILSDFYDKIEEGIYKNDDAINILNLKIDYLETIGKSICEKYGRLELVLLFRRLPADFFYDRYESSSTSINVQRMIMLFIMKNAKKKSNYILWTKSQNNYNSWLHYDYDMSVDLSILIMICERIVISMNRRRVIWKDGVLKVNKNDMEIKCNKNLDFILKFHDKRLQFNNALIFSKTGFGANFDIINNPKVLYAVPYCYYKKTEEDNIFYTIKNDKYNLPKPNHYFDYYNAIQFIKILELYELDYNENNDDDIKELITFFISISNKITIDFLSNTPYMIYQITQRGLLFYILTGLKTELEYAFKIIYEKIFQEKYEKDVSKIINYYFDKFLITYDFNDFDLNLFNPQSAFYEFEKSIGIDLTYFLIMLPEFIKEINISNQTREIKGRSFEHSVHNFIFSMLPALDMLFEPNKKLKINGTEYAEIDLSYIVKDIALVIDCKGYKQTAECSLGEQKETDYRWLEFDELNRKLIAKAKKLSENPYGSNYSIPSNVKKIVPIICSSSVEFLFEISSFLTNDIPNICTPLELLWYITQLFTNGLYSDTLVFDVIHDQVLS